MATLSEPIAVTGTTTPETWFETTTTGAGPADAGSLTVTVVDAADFADTGYLTIGGETHKYIAVDDDTGLVTLETPLDATYAEGERVDLYPAAFEKFADVMVGDFSEAVQVTIPHELWNKIADGIREDGSGEVVTFGADEDELTILEVHGQAPIVDGGYLDQETTPPEAFMDGSLYGTIGFVTGGFVAGDPFGAYVEMSALGITATDPAGEQTFQIDSATGNVTTVGMFASALAPTEPHVVIGDLAGTGMTRSFMYFYTGQELNTSGLPVSGYWPGEVSSGVDTDGTRYIRLASPDTPSVAAGELSVKSSVDTTTRPSLEWSGDIRLNNVGGATLYALRKDGTLGPLNVQGQALVLGVTNGTIRLGESTDNPSNKLRSMDTAGVNRRQFEVEADTILLDVTGGNLKVREAPSFTSSYGQIMAPDGNVSVVWTNTDTVRIATSAGDGWQPIGASAFNVNSDRANKKDAVAVDPAAALAAVSALTAYDYTRTDNGRKQRGLMAQDVAQAVPVAVSEGSGDVSVELYSLITTVAMAVQALTGRVTALEPKGQVKK